MNIITMIKTKRIRWMEHVPQTGKLRNSHKILTGTLVGKRHEARSRIWEDNIEMDHKELDCRGVSDFKWLRTLSEKRTENFLIKR
jgi:hypothetical protein